MIICVYEDDKKYLAYVSIPPSNSYSIASAVKIKHKQQQNQLWTFISSQNGRYNSDSIQVIAAGSARSQSVLSSVASSSSTIPSSLHNIIISLEIKICMVGNSATIRFGSPMGKFFPLVSNQYLGYECHSVNVKIQH
jgi:hypothetical protein